MNDTTIETPVATGGKDKGFTLVELLIVIVVLGILATVTVFAVRGITDNAQDNACATDEKIINTALEAYYADNGAYPVEAAADDPDVQTDGLALLQSGDPQYLKSIPATFVYANSGDDFTLTGTGDCAP